MTRSQLITASLLLLALAAAPAAGQLAAPSGWGLRFGFADDPDQVVAGAFVAFGELIPKLRFQPGLDLGSGDNEDVLTLTLPVHYRYLINPAFRIYVGGGLGLSWIDQAEVRTRTLRRAASTDFDIGLILLAGFEREIANGIDLVGEYNVGGGAAFGQKLVVGVAFHRK